jgi:aryl-alcohol dehydrogenase-like predicted oxidoreductase
MKLALGTVQFGLDYGVTNYDGQVTIDKVKSILNYAKDNGIDTLDTAAGYGNSEQVLGEVGVNDYQVVTKTTSLKNGVDEVIKSFHQSLNNLNIGQVDGLLIHDINEVKDKEFNGLFKQLNELKRQGLVNKIGFSTYTPEQVDFLLGNFDFDLIQVPFNVFDTRLVESGQLKELNKKNIEIHARSVFLQGVLLSFDSLSDYFSAWGAQFERYQGMIREKELSLLEYALNFALNIQEIDKILVGVNSENQLREIVQAVKDPSNLAAFPINDINLLNPGLWKV